MTLENNKWGEFNKSLLEEAKKGDWGSYRNIRLDMAEFLEKEGRLEQSLETYLEILYIDQSGTDSNFDLTMAFIAPGIIDRVRILSKKLKITLEKIEETFIRHNQRVEKSLKLPVNSEDAWEKIKPELEKFL